MLECIPIPLVLPKWGVVEVDPNAGALAVALAGALNANAGCLLSLWLPKTGLALKLKAGDVLPKAGGAVKAAFVFTLSAGFALNNPVV